ncbi:MAG: putative DNA binding domain-containing protein [Vallitaleaceae bacterium]|nr:putative DNA binding domain-containing protein [Vallitaleaceae bacterium]
MIFESDTVELKETLTKSVIKEIVAFTNTYGGKVYIGIADDGSVVGVTNPKKDIETLSSMIRDGIVPSILYYVSVQEITLDEKKVILVEVQRGDGKPYYISDKGMKPSGVYRRLGNTSVPVSEDDLRKMIIDNHGITYESTRSFNQELTFHYLTNELEAVGLSFEDRHLKSLDMIDKDGLYNNLALLLSDQCPHIIKVAVFADDDKFHFQHRQEFDGSVLKQMKEGYRFLEMQNHIEVEYQGLERIDLYDYHPLALREGLLNAILHRDYSMGGSIFINMYASFCEFISMGKLPGGLELDDIMEGVSKPGNEKLAGIFYRLKWIEAYGTGIAKIMGSYKNLSQKASYKITSNAVILRLPKLKNAKQLIQNEAEKESVNVVKNEIVKEDFADYYVDDESLMINLLEEIKKRGRLTRKEVEDLYGFGQTKSGTLLRILTERGDIKKIGKGRKVFYVYNHIS